MRDALDPRGVDRRRPRAGNARGCARCGRCGRSPRDEIPDEENLHVITLTAVADGGIFTFEDVVGHNYWRRTPEVARPVVRVGETVICSGSRAPT